MPRFRSKKKLQFHLNKKTKFVIIILFIIVAIVFVFRFINNRITPTVMDYAKMEAKKLVSVVLYKSISKKMINLLDPDKLFEIEKNADDEITSINFNTDVVNTILVNATNGVQTSLKALEEGNTETLELPNTIYLSTDSNIKNGIIFEIPSGVVFSNTLLSNLGPKIPVKISLIGDIFSKINTKVTDYGLNNALIEINLELKISEQVILPTKAEEIVIETSVPIGMKIIAGKVPSYYIKGINESQTLSMQNE